MSDVMTLFFGDDVAYKVEERRGERYKWIYTRRSRNVWTTSSEKRRIMSKCEVAWIATCADAGG